MSKQQRFTDLIVELCANKSDEDRERSRNRLQEQYEDCDSRLNVLIKDNRGNLSNTVELCSKIKSTVDESRTRCRALKDRIIKCQSLLQCNRDNIRKMWLESLEHKYAHRMLSEIEELRKIPREVNESLMGKKLEHATDVIVSSVKLLDGNLCNADALKDLKLELQNLQEKLYLMVLEDLRKNLHLLDFINSSYEKNLVDITYDDIFSNQIPPSDHSLKEILNKISFDRAYTTVLLNCLTVMKKLPDSMEFLKENCYQDSLSLSKNVSKLMYDVVEKSVDSSPYDLPLQRQHIFLVDLAEHTIAIFRKILDNYKGLFEILQNVVEINSITDIQFQTEDIFSKIQASVADFVEIYLESNSSNLFPQKDAINFTSSQDIVDIGSFFSPQNVSEDKNPVLYKFSNSCHGINIKKYSQEAKIVEGFTEEAESSEKNTKPYLVCRPTMRNITLIFNLLREFVSEIEQCLNLVNGDHCPLYTFLYDSANLFLDHVNSDINKMLKSASANLEAWNTAPIGDGDSVKSTSEKEVLSCSFILDSIMKELQHLMSCMPDYANHFFRLIYYVILDYKDMFHRAFKQMFEEEQNILSVSWARDRDIRRLMKSFLNWRHLEDDEINDMVESPEEIRLRNKEESELLIRNLRSEDQTSWDIITDMNKLMNLALLQENLIWFSVSLLKFIKRFKQSQPNSQVLVETLSAKNSENNGAIAGLRKVIKEYEDFADTCLLALHLEVRARCFHYLLPFSTHEICIESTFVQELDTAVKHLTSDLLQIDEVLLPILTTKELKYVFEGLGELVASLMIIIVSNMNKINEAVVRRIDRNIHIIQCCLANITMAREIAVERARLFIDLLGSTCEEILNQIVEEGPRFNEQEYTSVFKLISYNTTAMPRELEYYLGKLRQIFERLAANTKDIPSTP